MEVVEGTHQEENLEDNGIVADEISFCNHGYDIKMLGGGCGKKF